MINFSPPSQNKYAKKCKKIAAPKLFRLESAIAKRQFA
jgi:hypothetical protein